MLPPSEERRERRIALAESWDKDRAVREARDLAAQAGFRNSEQVLIATAVSELATNILRYAGRGDMALRLLREPGRLGIEVLAVDQGPGIADLDRALQDHFTTTPGSLGLGLPSVRRIMDEFRIDSGPGRGTRIQARKWRPHAEP